MAKIDVKTRYIPQVRTSDPAKNDFGGWQDVSSGMDDIYAAIGFVEALKEAYGGNPNTPSESPIVAICKQIIAEIGPEMKDAGLTVEIRIAKVTITRETEIIEASQSLLNKEET